MLDMLGEDARAAVGKVKQLQSQGATPDQVQAQMMEAARNGLLPISVAFAAQKALQRKNPPSPPPQGTVMSEMLGQLQDPREQGIAGLENPVMDNAQYAGGGIVAFAEAGAVKKKEKRPLTPEEEAEYQKLRAFYAAVVKPVTYWGGAGLTESPEPVVADPATEKAKAAYRPRFDELSAMRNEWERGGAERETTAGAEKISQQYFGAALPVAPGAPAAAAKTDAAGVATLDPTKIQGYLNAGAAGSRNDGATGLAGLRAPRMNTSAYDTAMNAAIAQSGPTTEETAAAKKTRDELGQEEIARYQSLGIGAGREKQREKLGKKREDLEGDRKRSKLEEIGLGFLTEGVAAASRGESTLGALASGLGAGLKGAKLSKEKLDAASDKLDEQEAALDQQKEALLLQGDTNALRRWEINQNAVKEARKVVTGLELQRASTRLGVDQFNIGNEYKLELARLQVAASKSKLEKATDPLFDAALAALKQNDIPSYNYFRGRIAELTSAGAAGVQTEALRQEGKAAETKLLTNPAGAGAGAGKSSAYDRAVAIVEGG